MYFVVIVEPEEVNAERIRAILESVDKNFEYELTSLPERGIELVENRKVDVFISSLELAVMTGAELFSMIEMISPETVRVAMTNPDRIEETVACMSQCKTFKVIIKPCRVAEDLLEPINASISYKEMREKVRAEEENANMGFFNTERDFKRLLLSWREKFYSYQRVEAVLKKILYTNIEAAGFDPSLEAKLKSWYDWVIKNYIKAMIDSDGQFETAEKKLITAYHQPEEGNYFQIKKEFEEEILPEQMNEIQFILEVILAAYQKCVGKYRIAAIIENADRAYILRVACALPREGEVFAEPDAGTRKAIAKAAEEAIAAFDNKCVMIEREKEILVNVAVCKQ
ncbi:MAG: response regulator [Roseburia sp.]|nr:response regulator [Roseburia sp.]